MNKKGFAVMFSWIFAIMAGIIIFLSLVYFAVQHTDLFGRLSGQRAVEELDIAFTSMKDNLIGSKLIFDKNIKLEFKCDETTLNKEKLFINKRSGKTLKGKLVFSQQTLESNEFFVWTADWNVPFKVTNFIFLSDKSEKYNLNEMPSDLKEKIPQIVKENIMDSSGETIAFEDLSRFNTCGSGKQIYLEKDSVLEEYYGKICVRNEAIDFIGDAIIFAYVFSDENTFWCLFNNAINTARDISEIYAKKTEILNCIPNGINADTVRTLDFSNVYTVRSIKLANNNLWNRGECEGIF